MSQHDDKADPALAQLHLFRSSRDAAPRLSENALVTNKESKTVAGAKPLAVSTSTDVATYWERLVLAVYVLFLFLFITGGADATVLRCYIFLLRFQSFFCSISGINMNILP